jgi:predicted secreted Zn-dependent protease
MSVLSHLTGPKGQVGDAPSPAYNEIVTIDRITRLAQIAAAALAFAFAPGMARSQMYLCEGAHGKVYSDVPCGSDSKRIEVRPSGGGASVNPNASVETQYYEIRGTTYPELLASIRAGGPEGWWGTAYTKITYELTTRMTPAGCAVDTVRASAASTMRLPRWSNRHEASAKLQQQWDGNYRSLELHERGHVQLSLDAARDLERAIMQTAPQASCALLQAEARKHQEALRARTRERQVAYDAETQHGLKQWTPYR